MSQERVDMVRHGIEAWNRHDFDYGADNLAEDIEWVPASPAAVEQPVYHGKDAVARAFNQLWDTWDLWEFEEEEIRDLGDKVLWLGRVHMRGGASQVEMVQEAANLLVFENDKVVRVQGFRSWQDAVEAADA
jgi:ketosteroid isomerase-like protein